MYRLFVFLCLFGLLFVVNSGQAPPFVVTQPNSSSQWLITRSYNITWNTTGITDYVSVLLIRSDSQQLVEYFKPNSGCATVVLDLNSMSAIAQTYTDWQIRVEDAKQPSSFAISQNFTIIYPVIQAITSPVWIVDENQTISYSVTLNNTLVDYVSITLFDRNGFPYVLSSQVANTGSFLLSGVKGNWLPASPFSIVICWVAYPSVCGTSLPFIVSAPAFDISTPSSVYVGGSLDIQWYSEDVVKSVSIWLVLPDIDSKYLLCGNTASSLCTMLPLPYWLYESDAYLVSVCWDKYSYICATSTNFSILAVINLQKSNLDSILVTNGMYDVEWDSREPISLYTLTLCKRYSPFSGGVNLYNISQENMQNKFTWGLTWNSTLPNSTLPVEKGAIYFLKVSFVVQDDTIYGISNTFALVDRASVAALQVSSKSKFTTKDTATITWKAATTLQLDKAPIASNNVTLPFVSIFLTSDNLPPVKVVTHYPFNSWVYDWVIPANLDTANYQWQMCYSSGLLDNINCVVSSEFALTAPGLQLSKVEIIVGAALIFLVLLTALILVIVCIKRRRRQRIYRHLQASENEPLMREGGPSSAVPPTAPQYNGEGDNSSYLCKICYEKPLDVLLLPCNHLCVCESCSNSAQFRDRCPVCNTHIEHKQKIFVA